MMRLNIRSIDKRKLARIIAVVAVALAAGHLVQTVAERKSAPARAAAMTAATTAATTAARAKPVAVVQLAAAAEVPDEVVQGPLPAPLPPVAMALLPDLSRADPLSVLLPDAAPVVVADPCAITLDLTADAAAMLGVALRAPCHANQRVVLRHAGLAVTEMTSETGALVVSLPALEAAATVEIKFADGTKASSAALVPGLSGLRRFGVQWQGDDAFQLFGYEGDAVVSAGAPGLPPMTPGSGAGGYLTRLGDAGAETALLAEIYTFPVSSPAELVIEAAVTPATCDREILGETLSSVGGGVTVTELTLAMPECAAVGDFLVLNNLAPDLTLALAN